MTAQEAISKFKQGIINRKFPEQFRNSTIDQIEAAAKTGDREAKSALKLLFDSRFDKP